MIEEKKQAMLWTETVIIFGWDVSPLLLAYLCRPLKIMLIPIIGSLEGVLDVP